MPVTKKAVALRVDAMELMELIARIAALWDKKMKEQLREHKVTDTQFRTLAILREKGTLNLGQLSEVLACAPCNVTGVVDRLELSGLVKRERGADDRRVVNVVLTESGKTLARDMGKAVLPELSELSSKAIDELSDKEIETLCGILSKVQEAMLEE